MQLKQENKYDVIVIGAGISGLICGTILAKNGVKVLIVEKNNKVGGYCCSFIRNSFKFDAGVHYLGSLRQKGGQLRKILDEIELTSDLELVDTDISDKILFLDFEIIFGKNLDAVTDSFKKNFSNEIDSIRKFIIYISKTDFSQLYRENITLTFRQLLDKYFKSEYIKQIFSTPLGNAGASSNKIAAISAIILFREYIFDSGYYPKGGMQAFSDKICQKFKTFGGEILLNSEVTKILLTTNNEATAIIIDDGERIEASYIVSCIDSFRTFFDLFSKNRTIDKIRTKIKKLVPSFSAFVIYLGVKNVTQGLDSVKCSTWFCPEPNIDAYYGSVLSNHLDFKKSFLLISRPTFFDKSLAPSNSEIISVFTAAPFKDIAFWEKNRKKIVENILYNVKKVIPGITNSNILVKESATPLTFYKFTYNYRGALYGWAPIVDQISSNIMPMKSPAIKNMLFAGHWTTQGYAQGGIPVVAISGRNVAKKVLNTFFKTKTSILSHD